MDVVRIFRQPSQITLALIKLALSIALCLALGFHIHKAWDSGFFRYKIRRLNQVMPNSFNYLIAVEKIGSVNPGDMVAYAFFYERLIHYFPDQADGWGMLGFCRFYAGDLPRARDAFEKAIALDGDFFWFHYNLGVLDYRTGRYKEALESFKKALSLDPQKTLDYILSSRIIYRSIMIDAKISFDEIRRRLNGGYQTASLLLKITKEHLKQKRSDAAVIGARIF